MVEIVIQCTRVQKRLESILHALLVAAPELIYAIKHNVPVNYVAS
jgi:hypothetical protein